MSKVLSVVLAVILVLLCLFWYQSCDKDGKITVLTKSEVDLKAENNAFSGRIMALQGDLDAANKALTAAQGKNAELTTALTELQAKADKSQKGNVWWCAEAGRLKKLLEAAKDEQEGIGGKIRALEGEKEKLETEKADALAEKANSDRLLTDLRGKSEADRNRVKDAATEVVAAVEKKLKAANTEIANLGRKLADFGREITRLKNRVLSAEKKAEKKAEKRKAAADNFKIYVVFTAVNPALHLKGEIRALAAELLPKIFGRTDNELYEIATPVMAQMPTQDDVSTVPLLHKAWAEWKDLRENSQE